MDFNAIWPLLRKEGWDAKHGTGMQIHHNYVKPGRRVRGGRQGVDFFNGEDELQAYVRTDVELCNRLKMSNVMYSFWIRSKAHSAETTNSSCSYGVAQSAT
ncbi:hypothetical protein C6341_g25831 [Phytophthora cactorum]|nr:hypothetical protein C6341_g25831 [Phytophthora cactorum]KAG4038651.1 hypothetical protein PC123_g25788 [Phytophthora cactorum]